MSTGSRFLNRFRVILDKDLTPANAIDKALKAHPERRLLHFDRPTGYSALSPSPTVKEMHAFVLHAGQRLKAARMKRGDRVVTYKTNSPDYFLFALAIIRTGGIAVPVNPGLPLEALRRYISDVGAQILIADQDHFARQIGDPRNVPEIRCWMFPDIPAGFRAPAIAINAPPEAHQDEGPAALAPDDPVMIVHTSGTTGFPKGVICTCRGIAQGIKRHYLGEPVSVRNTIGLAGHFNHLVCNLGLFTSLMGNIPVRVFTDLSPASLLAHIESHKVDIFFAFPDLFLAMYIHGLEKYDLSSVRVWISTADASHRIHMQAFSRKGAAVKLWGRRLLGAVFLEPLGSSEVGFAALEGFFMPWTRLRTDRRVGWGTIGGPSLRVVDEAGRRVPRYRPGRLMVKGPTVFAGYWVSPDRSKSFDNGWFWTGDIVYRDWLGRYYHLDRDIDVIRTAQGNVYSLPAEECLLQHPGIAEVAVIGVAEPASGPDSGVVPIAIIQLKPGVALHEQEILEWAGQRLGIVVPLAAAIIVDPSGMPRGLTGKVLKTELRKTYEGYFRPAPGLRVGSA